jgi:hypothetical protein
MPKTKAEMAAEADGILEAALDNTLTVFRDANAPATARASAVSSALRIYELLAGDDPGEKEVADMSADEIKRQLAKLRRGQHEG